MPIIYWDRRRLDSIGQRVSACGREEGAGRVGTRFCLFCLVALCSFASHALSCPEMSFSWEVFSALFIRKNKQTNKQIKKPRLRRARATRSACKGHSISPVGNIGGLCTLPCGNFSLSSAAAVGSCTYTRLLRSIWSFRLVQLLTNSKTGQGRWGSRLGKWVLL